MKLRALLLLVLAVPLLPTTMHGQKNPPTSRRIGDLLVTIVGTDRGSVEKNSDHYPFVVHAQAVNVGKQALCVAFRSTVKATFGLQYNDEPRGAQSFRVSELLPGEKTEGDFVFSVKNSATPLEIALRQTSESQTCVRGRDSLSSIWHGGDEVTFSLWPVSHPAAATNDAPPADRDLAAAPKEGAGIRVFLTSEGREAKREVVKSFQSHCSQVIITVQKTTANFLVDLTPATFKHSNRVTVVTPRGDLVYSGETYNLKNAANDACRVILERSKSAPKSEAAR